MNHNYDDDTLKVVKRDGTQEDVAFDKVTSRVKYMCKGVLKDGTEVGESLKHVNHTKIAQNVISTITDGITTRELDEYAARYCAGRVDENYEYGILAGRIAVSNHQKNTLGSFSDTMKLLYENCDSQGVRAPLLRKSFIKSVMRNREALDRMVVYERDYRIDYFGFMTLQKSYLLRRQSQTITVVERPQHVYMRIAVALHGDDLEKVSHTYDLLSLGYVSHASPTMFNAGTNSEQLSSCFLLGLKDSMDDNGGIPDCWKSCAMISKRAGGIGVGITPIRGKGSMIRGVNGPSDGIVPMVQVFDRIARYVNQGGRRKGSFAMYIEPWHPDIVDYLDLRKTHGKEELRARDLFYALWIPDLFMKRVMQAINEKRAIPWSLMCPDASHKPGNPRLYETYGDEFEKLYLEYEKEGLAVKTIDDIRELWRAILTSQKETGTPYMLYKDSVNRCNNQANLGVIRNSNLCAEIVEYSDHDEHAVCNLASIALHRFVEEGSDGKLCYNMNKLYETARTCIKNLDRVIDINAYPTPQTKRSNFRHRPVGLGVQGLADTFFLMKYPFDSKEAAHLNKQIFETIYYGCMVGSMELAKDRQVQIENYNFPKDFHFTDEFNALRELPFTLTSREYAKIQKKERYIGAYSSFYGSPMSQGKFQFDMWNESPDNDLKWDWEGLRSEIMKYGTRNSLTTAIMPTASTASILRSVECIEPVKFNLYTRRVLSGEFVLINHYMQRDLMTADLWTKSIRNKLIKERGSIQNIMEIPKEIRDLYKTAFEIKQRCIIDLARGRAPFIDQTQSMNIFCAEPNNTVLTSIHNYAWKQGLKTGMYYLRRTKVAAPVQFTVKSDEETATIIKQNKIEDDGECEACSA